MYDNQHVVKTKWKQYRNSNSRKLLNNAEIIHSNQNDSNNEQAKDVHMGHFANSTL